MHASSLDLPSLSRGLVAGSDAPPLFSSLERGAPLSVAILGASVAQNGGCLSQPGRRCMDYRGVSPVQMVWGEPRTRPFKGYWVRWFEWLQARYPHANHSLFNGARDATPVQVLLPCVFAYIPPGVGLVFLELGSMLYHHAKDNGAIEALVRKLLSLSPRPTLCFVTVPLWCKCRPFCRVSAPFGIKRLPNYSYTLLDDSHRASTHTESAVIERNLEEICRHYSLR